MILFFILLLPGCKLDMKKFPYVNYPYVASFEVLKHLEYTNDKIINKKKFKNKRITMPCFFLLKVAELENKGTISLVFYNTANRRISRRVFEYGKPGGYYNFIVLWGKITELKEGKNRYCIFYNSHIIYEGDVILPGKTSPAEKK